MRLLLLLLLLLLWFHLWPSWQQAHPLIPGLQCPEYALPLPQNASTAGAVPVAAVGSDHAWLSETQQGCTDRRACHEQ